ncbi:MAG TPA: hypothetical protein VHL11_16140 [Phototrophicaceae bacterium]|nr:hypothetical protein [Phototrophicaceae bacterium]
MVASSITTFLNIKFQHKRLLEQVLKEIGNPLKENNPYLCYSKTTHFARLVILPGGRENDLIYPGQEPLQRDDAQETRYYRLMFNAVFDGDLKQFVEDLVRVSPNIGSIFMHCEGYTDTAHLYQYLTDRRYMRTSQIFYDTFVGETVDSIRDKATLRDKIQQILDDNLHNVDVALEKVLQLSPVTQPPASDDRGAARQSLILAGIAAIVLVGAVLAILWAITPILSIAVGALIVFTVLWVFNLLKKGLQPTVYGAVNDQIDEHNERVEQGKEYYPVSMLTGREDVVVQNQFNLYLTFKGNWIERHLRLSLMIVLMYALGKGVQSAPTPGSLGGLSTVHFGHWILIDGGRRLFFITNYDGSWENYIADFVNKIFPLLDIQLMNFVGFSSEGTRNIAAFRRWLRRVQIQSDVFYSGYPFLTVRNTLRDLQINAGFPKDRSEPALHNWLKLLASPQFNQSAEQTPEHPEVLEPKLTRADWNDIQAFIVYGYGRFPYGRYLFLNIQDAEKAKKWLEGVIPLTTTVDQWDEDESKRALNYAVNIAFTNPALQKLGVEEETLKTFSREFREGIAPQPKSQDTLHPRSIILGDTGISSPRKWGVGNLGDKDTNKEVHILLMINARDDTVAENLLKTAVFASIASGAAGVTVAYTEQGWMPHDTQREVFGFHDGISNPWLEGTRYNIRHADGTRGEPLKVSDKVMIKEGKHERREILLDRDVVIRTGEFILGYPNEYKQLPLTPLVWNDPNKLLKPFAASGSPSDLHGVKDLGRNGSYMVYRKLQQDVQEFWNYIAQQASVTANGTPDTQDMQKIAAKIVGRWPSGVPLVLSPDHDDYDLAAKAKGNNSLLNNFHYRPTDEQGLSCPFGSHLRRGNPRDSLIDDKPQESIHNSNLHRIMRRAVAFGKLPDHQIDPDYFKKNGAPLKVTYDGSNYPEDKDGVGIHFFGINTNIQQQFEFIQQAWNNNAHFNGMYENKDALTGDNVETIRAAVPAASLPGAAASAQGVVMAEVPDARAETVVAKYAEQGVKPARLQAGSMTIPEEPIRERLDDIHRFVNVKGGAYLFLPSISAMKYFAQLPPAPKA